MKRPTAVEDSGTTKGMRKTSNVILKLIGLRIIFLGCHLSVQSEEAKLFTETIFAKRGSRRVARFLSFRNKNRRFRRSIWRATLPFSANRSRARNPNMNFPRAQMNHVLRFANRRRIQEADFLLLFLRGLRRGRCRRRRRRGRYAPRCGKCPARAQRRSNFGFCNELRNACRRVLATRHS